MEDRINALFERLERIEDKIDKCNRDVDACSLSLTLLNRESAHQTRMINDRLDQYENIIETHQILLHGNPRQDSKDRGMIGDVEQLKSADERKKKLYWLTVTAVMALLVTSFWNSIFGKEDHGRSEVSSETKVNKTGPGTQHLRFHDRSDREGR